MQEFGHQLNNYTQIQSRDKIKKHNKSELRHVEGEKERVRERWGNHGVHIGDEMVTNEIHNHLICVRSNGSDN